MQRREKRNEGKESKRLNIEMAQDEEKPEKQNNKDTQKYNRWKTDEIENECEDVDKETKEKKKKIA